MYRSTRERSTRRSSRLSCRRSGHRRRSTDRALALLPACRRLLARGGGLLRGGRLLRGLAVLLARRRDRRAQRFHQVGHRRLRLRGLRHLELVALELCFEQLAERGAVLAVEELLGLERPLE